VRLDAVRVEAHWRLLIQPSECALAGPHVHCIPKPAIRQIEDGGLARVQMTPPERVRTEKPPNRSRLMSRTIGGSDRGSIFWTVMGGLNAVSVAPQGLGGRIPPRPETQWPWKGEGMASKSRRAPRGLSPAGRRLWDAVTSDYELESHELLLLENAARTADLIADLQARIDADGPVLSTGKTHPAVAEIRQQRITLARCWWRCGCRRVMRMSGRRGSGAGFVGCIGWRLFMRRRPPPAEAASVPAELMDLRNWPPCPTYDTSQAFQPCACWFAERQREWLDAGNEWPGGRVQAFSDFLEVRGECRAPWDQSKI
jgi:hypothetical protein